MMMVKKQITHLMLYSVVIVVAAVVVDVVANILTDHKTLFHSLQITMRSWKPPM
jgi:hypothetical protein